MKFYNIILSVIIISFIILPVMGLETEQNIHSVLIGDNTVQDIDNTMNVYDESQDTTAIQIGGSHNNQVVTNNKVIGSASQSQSQFVTLNIPKPEASYRGFDIGVINTQFISMYEGDPLVISNDKYAPEMVVSQPGDKFRYTIKSSIPVLAYIIHLSDIDRVLYDSEATPVYDIISKKYETGNLDVVYMGEYRSALQQFEVTVEDPGRYAVAVDSRVSRNTDGRQTKITGNTFDVSVVIEKISNNAVKITNTNNTLSKTNITIS